MALFNAYEMQGEAALKKDVAYSHVHQGYPEVLDQILVSEEFVAGSRHEPGRRAAGGPTSTTTCTRGATARARTTASCARCCGCAPPDDAAAQALRDPHHRIGALVQVGQQLEPQPGLSLRLIMPFSTFGSSVTRPWYQPVKKARTLSWISALGACRQKCVRRRPRPPGRCSRAAPPAACQASASGRDLARLGEAAAPAQVEHGHAGDAGLRGTRGRPTCRLSVSAGAHPTPCESLGVRP